MIKKNIAQLLETEVERKDFLKLVGLGALATVGVSQVLKTLTQQTGQRQAPIQNALEYGGSAYGGAAKK